ncbi:MAG: adenine phosphoribosyltransferase [Dehalococcoidia bacterium]
MRDVEGQSVRGLIRTIPDYPKPGILFRDVTTLLADGAGLRAAIDALSAPYTEQAVGKVAAIEARGFILGGAIADRLGAGFVPVRKRGKLPFTTVGVDYALEYGVDRVEVHTDAIERGDRILLVDDLIATGGTAIAACDLIEQLGGVIVGVATIIDLPDLGGSTRIRERGLAVHALCEFEGH